MSKTSSAVVCETNQVLGQNQENVFFHSLYRSPEEFQNAFVRSAKSTSPIQICALLSAQGEDTQAAMTLQGVLKKFQALAAQAQLKTVLDYDAFVDKVVSTLNDSVCQDSIRNNGAKLRVSMSMVVLEGDTLRVMNIGNTRVWLFRQGKMISLTESQTIAHRYVQMGAITKEQEMSHEGKNELTQYLGRFPQDGEVIPDKNVHLKLLDGDEIIMLGTGIDQNIEPTKLGSVISRPSVPETKASDLVHLALDSGVQAGLTALVLRVERTLILPGDADFDSSTVSNNLSVAPDIPEVKQNNDATTRVTEETVQAPVFRKEEQPTRDFSFQEEENDEDEEEYDEDDEYDEDEEYDEEDEYEDDDDDDVTIAPSRVNEKKPKKQSGALRTFIKCLIIFLVFALIGFGGMYVLFNVGHLTGKLKSTTTTTTVAEDEITEGQVVYALYDSTSLYVEESLDSQAIDTLSKGEAVTLLAMNDNFAKVKKENGLMGYVPKEMIVFEDPTIGVSDASEYIDPTPIPSGN
ncbi:MAG: hypothetical protein J5752_03255 [Clostridiales bacterium]|nr:hypothetical protein [Clostridiales bacterium]